MPNKGSKPLISLSLFLEKRQKKAARKKQQTEQEKQGKLSHLSASYSVINYRVSR